MLKVSKETIFSHLIKCSTISLLSLLQNEVSKGNEQRAGKGIEHIFQGGEEEGGVLTVMSAGRS